MARVEEAPNPVDDGHRQQVRVRALTGVVALILVIAAVVLVTRHQRVTRSASAYCTQLSSSKSLTQVLASGDAAQIERAVADFDRAADVAPSAVEGPTRVVTAYADGLAVALRSGGGTEAALAAAVRRQEPQIPKVEAAGHQVAAWVSANCGFDGHAKTGS